MFYSSTCDKIKKFEWAQGFEIRKSLDKWGGGGGTPTFPGTLTPQVRIPDSQTSRIFKLKQTVGSSPT